MDLLGEFTVKREGVAAGGLPSLSSSCLPSPSLVSLTGQQSRRPPSMAAVVVLPRWGQVSWRDKLTWKHGAPPADVPPDLSC